LPAGDNPLLKLTLPFTDRQHPPQGGYDIVSDALMRPLGMIMFHVFINYISKVRLTEDEHFIKTFGFNAPDKSFYKWIYVIKNSSDAKAKYWQKHFSASSQMRYSTVKSQLASIV
jgi:hypothetical protein